MIFSLLYQIQISLESHGFVGLNQINCEVQMRDDAGHLRTLGAVADS